jgi:hypothetical protein
LENTLSNESTSDNKEFRILKAMKGVLTGIIRDTTVPAGHKHPLTDSTIEDIRQCLMLISAREQELIKGAGEVPNMKPRYVDEPQTSSVVPISKIGKRNKEND